MTFTQNYLHPQFLVYTVSLDGIIQGANINSNSKDGFGSDIQA
ncbi:hypothetical protein [Methylotenera mobilis]|nr:hypothetical protein [Methylotenera mobilis]